MQLPPCYTDVELDAIVLLRADVRGVTHERVLLALDRPQLSRAQLHASLRRLCALERFTWLPAEQLVRAPAAVALVLRRPLSDPLRAGLARAWCEGNAWRGSDLRGGGRPTAELERRYWQTRLALMQHVPDWPPRLPDDPPPFPAGVPQLADNQPRWPQP